MKLNLKHVQYTILHFKKTLTNDKQKQTFYKNFVNQECNIIFLIKRIPHGGSCVTPTGTSDYPSPEAVNTT